MILNFISLFAYILLFAQLSFAQVEVQKGINLYSVEYFWKEALETYITESEDYLESMSTTEQELKSWRIRVLQNKFETRISGLEVILSKSNFNELKGLEKIVETRGLDSLDDSLMMRLAQLHYDRANFDFNSQSKKLREEKNYKGVMPTPNFKKTIFYSKEIIKRFPKSSVLEHAYYLLGFCLFDEDKDAQAAKVYEEMLKTFPSTPLSFEARWRLAEYLYDLGNYKQAAENYTFLIKHPNSFSEKSNYKLGAAYYAQRKYAEAFKIFYKLFLKTSELLGSKDSDIDTLYNESLDYLAYLRVKNIEMDLSDDADSLITQRLSDIYKEKQNAEAARRVQLDYAYRRPFSKYSPRFLSDAMGSYEYDGLGRKAQKVRTLFLKNYSPQSKFWKIYSEDVSTTVENQDLYESVLLSSASYYADLARVHKGSSYYQTAIDYYNKFVDENSMSPLRSQAKYEMAELQYFSGKYSDAAATYMDLTIDSDSDEYKEESAYGYFLSEMKRIGYDPSFHKILSPSVDVKGNIAPATELTKKERQFFEAADFYTKMVPRGFRRQKILYKKAELLFVHNQFKEARQVLELIFKDQELSSVAPRALSMIAETYNIENNWPKVVETKRLQIELAKRQSFDSMQADELFKTKSPVLISAWRNEKRGDFKSASEQYDYYSVKYARSIEAPGALFKAGLLYKQIGQVSDSNRVLKRVLREYPKSSYAAQAEFLLASNEEAFLNFDKAIKEYEKVFKKYPKKEIGLQALLNAGSIEYALGNFKAAGSRYETYFKILDDDSALLTAAEIYKKSGDKKDALRIYNYFSKGKRGPALAIEAYLNKAEMAATQELQLDYCKEIKRLSQRSQVAKSATALHAVTGCLYFKSRVYTQKVNPVKLQQHWNNLSMVYDQILTSGDFDWIEQSTKELSSLYKRTNFEPVQSKLTEMQKKLDESKLQSFDVSKVPYKQITPEAITVRWPLESSLTRIAFDQGKWDELIKNAKIELSIKPQSYLYLAIARGYAELGEWDQAKDALKECINKTKEAICSAQLSFIDYKYAFVDGTYDPEDEAIIELARALKSAKQKKDYHGHFKKAVQLEPQYAEIYKFYALLLTQKQQLPLARLVLDAGLRNTQNDERLLVQKGYLSFAQKDMGAANAVMSEMKYYDYTSDNAILFQAYYYYLNNNNVQATALLNRLKASPFNMQQLEYAQTMIHGQELNRLPAEEKK